MQVELNPSAMPRLSSAKIAILQAKWYREYIDKMVEKCVELLRAAGCPEPEHYILPGSLELPLAAQTLIRDRASHAPYDAIICFGAIMKGETYHFDMIMDMCSRGFSDVMLSNNVPIIMEVLPVNHVDQLIARSREDHFNKGIEAALATAEIIDWRRKVLQQGK